MRNNRSKTKLVVKLIQLLLTDVVDLTDLADESNGTEKDFSNYRFLVDEINNLNTHRHFFDEKLKQIQRKHEKEIELLKTVHAQEIKAILDRLWKLEFALGHEKIED